MTGRQLDDVNGRLASIGKGSDMKQDLIKRNQTRITELLREVLSWVWGQPLSLTSVSMYGSSSLSRPVHMFCTQQEAHQA